MTSETTANTGQETTTETGVVLERLIEGDVNVTIVSPTGEESIAVPAAIAAQDDLLRSVLTEHGVSMAANALLERGTDGAVKLTKQADRNG
ncbi:hypothetical protein H6F76_03360 [Leptolyngbya sp. FACHB-321]|uniref:hypothetical protein n=1 Tax=Leptolyngbya sp. FACHB-321 TaxID=2692807 RepID=UPI0016879B1E|nr:hypothetical protein [Leptolyngbya sp. FACHB-321]MBD2034086.1 hypothetical protein [Leptolyngbya sp. FACHB-321]